MSGAPERGAGTDPAAAEGGVERCRECGAGLVADQRYCLNCGARRGEPRLDFRRYLAAGAASGPGAADEPSSDGPPPATPPRKPQRDFAPLAAAGGIAVLGLMLLVGVLIGRGEGGEQVAAPAPQVVRVQGGGGEEEATAREGGAAANRAGGAKAKKSKRGSRKARKAAPPAPAPEAITADDSELEALQDKSPQEYSEAAAKLPDEIATEGAPPPEDNRKPGGGSAGVAIE